MFGVVIADESHNIKTIDAKRTERVLPLLRFAMVAICLTGTPAVNRPVELYTQLHCLLPYIFNSYDAFVRRYCDAKPLRFGPHGGAMDVRGSSNELELKTLLEGLVMIRRLKKDVLNALPSKVRDVKYVDVDPAFAAEVQRLQRRLAALDTQIRQATNNQQQLMHEKEQALLQFYQVTGQCKLKSIQEELLQYLEQARVQRGLQQSLHTTATDEVECLHLNEDIEDNLVDSEDDNPRPKRSRKVPRDDSMAAVGAPEGMKILVFAHHQVVMDTLESFLRSRQIGYIRVDGRTTSAKRGELIRTFQTDAAMEVALLSITSCGTGLNLTVANLAIFAELYWTPGVVLQAEDRIHR